MRIIGGKYKGIPLASPKSENIRPTGDKVKQALFTKLQFEFLESKVLDLFSGSGALGIEALSRGASFVCFVDKDRRSIALTKQNLAKLEGNVKVMNCSYDIALKSLKQKFDIILIDPPYLSGVYENCLELIAENDLLTESGIVVCEHLKSIEVKSSSLTLYDKKIYGTVALSYFSKFDKS